ncbi:hypothetical protein GWN26_10505 [Candidatus Saccharibacteria bacterium]|nr:hypothetical protein [Candidatus Saccharibacteria bacterium]NIV99529.1 hypothetical protein [Candidatus Saccharibacteria bacterium]NIW79830.1 hypothetical protein [Calditrichia bacterium]
MAGIIFVVCCLTLVVVSLLTAPPPPEKVNNLTWSRKIYDDETRELKAAPIYQNYRIHSIIILVLLGIILAIFW